MNNLKVGKGTRMILTHNNYTGDILPRISHLDFVWNALYAVLKEYTLIKPQKNKKIGKYKFSYRMNVTINNRPVSLFEIENTYTNSTYCFSVSIDKDPKKSKKVNLFRMESSVFKTQQFTMSITFDMKTGTSVDNRKPNRKGKESNTVMGNLFNVETPEEVNEVFDAMKVIKKFIDNQATPC